MLLCGDLNSEYDKLSERMQQLSLIDIRGKNVENHRLYTKDLLSILSTVSLAALHSGYVNMDV